MILDEIKQSNDIKPPKNELLNDFLYVGFFLKKGISVGNYFQKLCITLA